MHFKNLTYIDRLGHTINSYLRSAQSADNISERLHLVHGTGFSALCNGILSEYLPLTWQCYLSDAPGHGGSTQPDIGKMPDWVAMADSLAENITHTAKIDEYGPVIGIGHSFGGVLTLLAAARHPELFKRIILFDPVLFGPTLIAGQHFARMTGLWKFGNTVRAVNKRRRIWPDQESMCLALSQKPLYRNWDKTVLADFILSGSRKRADGQIELACNPAWEASLFGSYPRKLWQHVKALSVPTDIILPKNTLIFIPPAARKAQKLNPNIQIHPHKSAIKGDDRLTLSHDLNNHCFPMEQPEATAQLVKQIINND